MSWTENEKLNEWLDRAFENGVRQERERIIKLLKEYSWAGHIEVGINTLISDIEGETNG